MKAAQVNRISNMPPHNSADSIVYVCVCMHACVCACLRACMSSGGNEILFKFLYEKKTHKTNAKFMVMMRKVEISVIKFNLQ